MYMHFFLFLFFFFGWVNGPFRGSPAAILRRGCFAGEQFSSRRAHLCAFPWQQRSSGAWHRKLFTQADQRKEKNKQKNPKQTCSQGRTDQFRLSQFALGLMRLAGGTAPSCD